MLGPEIEVIRGVMEGEMHNIYALSCVYFIHGSA